MKKTTLICAAMTMFLAVCDVAQADVWSVATVHGYDQFTIGSGGSSLLYHQQPRNSNGWYVDGEEESVRIPAPGKRISKSRIASSYQRGHTIGKRL